MDDKPAQSQQTEISDGNPDGVGATSFIGEQISGQDTAGSAQTSDDTSGLAQGSVTGAAPVDVTPAVPPVTDIASTTQDAPVSQPSIASPSLNLPDTSPPEQPFQKATPEQPVPSSGDSFNPPAPSPTTTPPPPPASGEVFLTDTEGGASLPSHHSSFPAKPLIVLGAIIVLAGIVVGGLYFWQRSSISSEPNTAVVDEKQQVSTTPPPQSFALTLENPPEGTVSATEEIVVAGKTSSKTAVVFLTDAGEGSVESDNSGAFSSSVRLATGRNKLSVFAVSIDGQERSITRVITYEAISLTKPASPSAQPTGDGQKKFIHGTVTGINESLLTILEDGGLDKFSDISASDSAVIKIQGSQQGSLASLDLGQRIAAVGMVDDNGSIMARLIHIISR